MDIRSCFRTLFVSQRVNGCQTLQKSAGEHFNPTFLWFSHRKSWKTSVLVKSETSGLFVNPMTADGKYFCRNTKNLLQPIQINLS